MTDRDLRAGRVERILATISIPQPFTLAAFVESVVRARDKRIELVRTRTVAGPCGLLLSTSTVDYIFYDGSSPLHRDHNVIHEIGHLMLRHRLAFVDDVRGLAAPFPDQPLSAIPHVISPVRYGGVEEEDADHFAALVLARLAHADAAPAEPVPGLSSAFALNPRRSADRWDWSPVRRGVVNCLQGVLPGYGVRTAGRWHG